MVGSGEHGERQGAMGGDVRLRGLLGSRRGLPGGPGGARGVQGRQPWREKRRVLKRRPSPPYPGWGEPQELPLRQQSSGLSMETPICPNHMKDMVQTLPGVQAFPVAIVFPGSTILNL